MKSQIFAIYDSKTGAYMEPWFTPTTETAIRAFAHSCSDPAHPLGMDPADYGLFHIGTYDNDTATLTQIEPRHNLGLGIEHLKKPENEDQPQLDFEDEDKIINAGGTN